eukprot:3741883-Prymnesium_polylepis.2
MALGGRYRRLCGISASAVAFTERGASAMARNSRAHWNATCRVLPEFFLNAEGEARPREPNMVMY